jgi:hypothetical protein
VQKGTGNLLITQIQSPDYVAGVSGWAIFQDGSAEFNNMTVRGVFNGTNFLIDSDGIFFYA